MEKPTEKQIKAVERTVEMWNWLADNPEQSKSGWFMKISRMPPDFGCYLCVVFRDTASEYEEESLNCHAMGTGCPLDIAGHNCDLPDSVFSRWCTADIDKAVEDKRTIATHLVNILNNWLDERRNSNEQTKK